MKYMNVHTGRVNTVERWIYPFTSVDRLYDSYDGQHGTHVTKLARNAFFASCKYGVLVPLHETHERVIFDNLGGVTLQLYGWAHYYKDSADALQPVAQWIETHDTEFWADHSDYALAFNPTDMNEYQIVDICDLPSITLETAGVWHEVKTFSHNLSLILPPNCYSVSLPSFPT